MTGKIKCYFWNHNLLVYGLIFCVKNLVFGQSNIPTSDKTFSNQIQSIQLYPNSGNGVKNQLNPAVVALQNQNLILEFDDIQSQYQNYHLKVFPCNPEWQLQNLNEVEYLSEFNDLIIRDYQLSYSTKVNYYHYKIELPATKIGGNFIAYVYKEQKKNEPVFTRRFCVNAGKVKVGGKASVSNNNLNRSSHQQVDFGIQYGGFQVINPLRDFKVVIRQNYRWDKTITNLKPQYLKASESKIDYQFYNGETEFEGGNEFRFFDMRSLRNRYVGVRKINYSDSGFVVDVLRDMPQGRKVYIFTDDFDGQYLIDHYENGNAEINGDYALVAFTLEAAEFADNEEVYICGAFNNFETLPQYKMEYDFNDSAYKAQILLKQGIYNYQYVVKNSSLGTTAIQKTEGNHSKTENTYEIFVYNKPMGGRSEQLVGYSQFQIFNR